MATKDAILCRLLIQFFLIVSATVSTIFAGVVGGFFSTFPLAFISTSGPTYRSDATSAVPHLSLYNDASATQKMLAIFTIISANFYPLRFYRTLTKMGDNLRRAVQEINLGVEDEPFALPADVVNQAIAKNRFILFGRPVIPRRQNLRSIVASMPRIWG
ncbi:hypothetical protein AtNW77_Chr3g0192851 [Arabidopsis thaliana]